MQNVSTQTETEKRLQRAADLAVELKSVTRFDREQISAVREPLRVAGEEE